MALVCCRGLDGVQKTSRRLVCLGVLLPLFSSACGLPRDPEVTLNRVSGGTLRVGISEHDPWVLFADEGPAGVEVEIVKRFAADIDAEIEWVEGEVHELAGALHMREIDLLIAGLTSSSTISSEGALTHPYLTTQVVVATPPGPQVEDIAGIEVAVEDATEEAGILEKTDAIPVRVDDVTEAEGAVAVDNYLLDDLELADTGVRLSETDHVMAVPHGENEWLVRLERFLLTRPGEIDRILEEHDGA